ncbi:MAG: helix-turn-helix domain-containing protein [Planctomycetes bacterium]|nr:helix-turn-helix domain-containing protein [Planctomycetota bacterium]
MLSTALVQEIDRLLKAGELPQRTIAERLGVSRGTVNAIARGHRGVHGREPIRDEVEVEHDLFHKTLMQRCPQCGYCVQMPCAICAARAYRQRQRMSRTLLSTRAQANRPTHSRPRAMSDLAAR